MHIKLTYNFTSSATQPMHIKNLSLKYTSNLKFFMSKVFWLQHRCTQYVESIPLRKQWHSVESRLMKYNCIQPMAFTDSQYLVYELDPCLTVYTGRSCFFLKCITLKLDNKSFKMVQRYFTNSCSFAIFLLLNWLDAFLF